ncbi:LLM class flavin-dependent oxidoreductase [Acinetobacter qingfengensis]|uniref:Oxidoreductase n=1 Tax=Acinetobacter qingfengensis TaxID=1262585 RepID=A0A1E7R411_9GAMM|nr:LLM class flavin-dependent oxidoreductase [Acinetobacter qingfengensis]KAA8733732.1 LLM class flavin-dependent oxidoreductase [Acinetobacter qingfengensis]OEY94044.1 oxidoreductase [Acinetobacter qingfengensis]
MSKLNIKHISFLIPGNYPDDHPVKGLEQTLQLFELGEQLGYNGAWVRQRHLEHGISSSATFLAAATQRTHKIELGTAVIQLGYESPFRLAEDLSTVDVLSHGRLNVGLSTGKPLHAELIAEHVFDQHWQQQDFSYQRVQRLIDNLSGRYLGDPDTWIESPGNRQRPRLQPYAKGLTERLWYGGGSLRSARWAGENQLNLLIGNLTSGEDTDDYYTAQLRQLALYRQNLNQHHTHKSRIAAGRVIIPFDHADQSTQRYYQDFAASRYQRTLSPQGERRTLFSEDIIGHADQILEKLFNDPVLQQVEELRLELPYEFNVIQYAQIITDFITLIAPQLGWKPTIYQGDKKTA